MLEFAPDALIVNSFSKYFSMAGWRLGWLLTPKGEDLERPGPMSATCSSPPRR